MIIAVDEEDADTSDGSAEVEEELGIDMLGNVIEESMLGNVIEDPLALLEVLEIDELEAKETAVVEDPEVVSVVVVELCVSIVQVSVKELVVLLEVPSDDVPKIVDDELVSLDDIHVILSVIGELDDDTDEDESDGDVSDAPTEFEVELLLSDEVLVILSIAKGDVDTGDEDEDYDDNVLDVSEATLLLSDDALVLLPVVQVVDSDTDETDDDDSDDELLKAVEGKVPVLLLLPSDEVILMLPVANGNGFDVDIGDEDEASDDSVLTVVEVKLLSLLLAIDVVVGTSERDDDDDDDDMPKLVGDGILLSVIKAVEIAIEADDDSDDIEEVAVGSDSLEPEELLLDVKSTRVVSTLDVRVDEVQVPDIEGHRSTEELGPVVIEDTDDLALPEYDGIIDNAELASTVPDPIGVL